jgi:hypothetical protein
VNAYGGLPDAVSGEKFDLVLVDGPIGSPHYSRYQFADIIENDLLADQFVMIMDDANRQGEKQTLQDAEDALRRKGRDYIRAVYSGEKDIVLICSPGWRFLATL